MRSEFRQVPIGSVFTDIIFIEDVNQFRESRCNPDSLFIFDALHTLVQHFFNNHGQVVPGLTFRHFIEIHEHRHKRCLSIAGHECNKLILYRLDTALYFLPQPAGNDFIYNGRIETFSAYLPFFFDLTTDFAAADIDERSQMSQCE